MWRLHGEDNNFLQVDNDIPRASTYAKLGGFYRDLLVDVVDGYISSRVQTPQDVQGTSYLPIQPNPKVKAFYYLLDQEKECFYD